MIFNSKIFSILIGALVLINANAQAQQVAILDSGADPNQGFNIAGGFNYFNNTDNTDDVSEREGEGHGTVSTRAISESFSGEILQFVITDGLNDRLNEDQVRVARDSALSDILGRNQVRVIAITWGTDGITGSAAPLIPQLSNANKVIAIMAGNQNSAQPNALSSTSFNLSGVIIVGAADADGILLADSNRAGTTANKFVVAIGLSSLDAESGGASWAAARIAGIAGAVLLQNPNLTAAEVVDIILQSAEDRGEAGIDSEYGWGFIRNAAQVLNNVIGPVTIPTEPTPASNGSGGGGGGAILLLGGAVAGALLLARKPSAKLEKTLVLDSYGRAFQIDLNGQIAINDGSLHLNDFFQSLNQTFVTDGFYFSELNTEVVFGASTQKDHRFDMVKYFSLPDDVMFANDQANLSIALRSQLTEELELSAGYKVSPSLAFGAVSQLESHEMFGTSSFISGQSFSSVLSGFSPQAHTASLAYKPRNFNNTSIKLGIVSVDQAQRFGQDSFSTILEGAYQFTDNAGLSVQFGQIEEHGSLFGGAAGGIFGVKTATTYALNLSGRIKTSDRFSLVANYGIGRTHVDSAEKSLLNDFSSISTDWYSIGLIGNNVIRKQDQIGFSISQPLKVRSGAVNYSIPIGREINGNITFDSERVNLSETGATEQSFEGYYRTMLNEKIELGSFLAYRKNPNHINDNGNEMLFMATLKFLH